MSWSAKRMNMKWVKALSRQQCSTRFRLVKLVFLTYRVLMRVRVQVRHYSPTRWVSTDAEAYFMGVGAAMAFRRLFQYITGSNEGGKKSIYRRSNWALMKCISVWNDDDGGHSGVQMDMTAPVLVKIPEKTKMWEPAIYTLNFPLPSAYQDNPPAPTNDKVSPRIALASTEVKRCLSCR